MSSEHDMYAVQVRLNNCSRVLYRSQPKKGESGRRRGDV